MPVLAVAHFLAYLANGVDVDVVLSLLWVRHEWLHEEIPQRTLDVLNLLNFVCTSGNPLLGLWPCGIELEQPRLASTLDQLIGLRNEFCARCEEEWVFRLCGVQDSLYIIAVCECDGCELCGRVVGRLWSERSWLDHRSASEVVVENGLAIAGLMSVDPPIVRSSVNIRFENRLCGHTDGGAVVWRITVGDSSKQLNFNFFELAMIRWIVVLSRYDT